MDQLPWLWLGKAIETRGCRRLERRDTTRLYRTQVDLSTVARAEGWEIFAVCGETASLGMLWSGCLQFGLAR